MNRVEDRRPETPKRPQNLPTEPAGGPDDPRVIRALEEYLAALLEGHKPNRHEFAARHLDIAADLAICLDGLEFVHAVAPDLSQPGTGESFPSPLAAEIQAATPLGDFRILREIGRGGMGVVYEAEQLSLGRRVALKVLPFAAALDARHLQRFKQEAQAAAHLHHQNIVPVYGVGCERGVHYYAMQFIDGQPLADLIRQLRLSSGLGEAEPVATSPYMPPRRLPSGREMTDEIAAAAAETNPQAAAQSTEPSTKGPNFFRTAAQLGVQAAEALEHAHQLGVVHRDIKPGNLLVDPRGNLWITDFGLAQFQNDGNLTMTGDLLGTIRYMSPEQTLAQGVPLDHRTDIYSLGVTLYELLTLEAAFSGTDRQELLQQIAWEEPRPPRRLNKAIPAELETIVLKAMEKNAAERYATAQELADDLRRFLEDRPIRAKRPTLWQKVKRLLRRNKGVVRTILLALAVVLVTVAVAASLGVVQLEKHAKNLDEERKATLKQLDLTRTAEKKGRRHLYRALVAQARGNRLSRRVGQRFKSLEVLAEASRMARDLELPEKDFLELRNEAIACLVLPDLRVAKEWAGWPTGSMTVDFDGKLERYARVDRQGVVHIHRVADDAEIYRLAGFGSGNFGPGRETLPYFSPDGRFLLLTRGERFQVWKLAGQGPNVILDQSACIGNDFSPDSRQFVLGHADGSIHLYDLSSGRQLEQLRGVPNSRHLAFHPQARQLAISHPTGVQIHDLATGSVLADLPQPAGAWRIAWHPDGKTLAVDGGDRIIYIWDVATRKPIARLEGHKADGIIFAFNHAGDLLVSMCWDGILRLWDPRTGRQVFSPPVSGTASLRFSPDDQLLAASSDENKLRLWQVSRARGYRTLVRDPALGQGEYHVCATAPGDRLLAVGMTDGVGLWDLPSGNPLAFLPIGRYTVVQFATSSALLINGPAGLLHWPIQRDSTAGLLRIGPPRKLPLPGNDCWIAASRDGRVVASAQRWGGLVWHEDLPGTPIRLSPHEDTRSIAVSPDGRWVATGSHWGTGVKIWQARTGQFTHELTVEAGSWVRFSPDGRWLATTGGGCRLWAVDSWREGPHIGGGAFAFSPDGKLLAVETGYGVVWLVNPDTGREYARLEDPNQDRSHKLCFSSDGRQLISATSGRWSLHIWDLRIVRGHLAEMGLDWDLPPYPPAGERADSKPLQVQVDLGDALNGILALAKNDEAWQLATHPEAKSRDPRRAVGMAKQAVELAPKEGIYWNTLGVAHYRAGHWRESIAALEKSMRLLSGRFESFNTLFLAISHWQQGDKEQARKWYKQAVAWMEKNKEALEKDKPHQEELRRFGAEAAALLEGKAKND